MEISKRLSTYDKHTTACHLLALQVCVCESRINALPYPFGSITESDRRRRSGVAGVPGVGVPAGSFQPHRLSPTASAKAIVSCQFHVARSLERVCCDHARTAFHLMFLERELVVPDGRGGGQWSSDVISEAINGNQRFNQRSSEVITVFISGHHCVGRSIAYALTLRVILLEIAPPPAGVERERPAWSVSMQGLSWYLMREAISGHQRQSEAITNQKVSMHYT